MKSKQRAAFGITVIGIVGAAYLASAAMAQDEKPPVDMPPMLSAEQVRVIWPAGLQRIAGRYVFSQVASPGGLWERTESAKGTQRSRQVSLNEVPAAFRQRLTTAEIVISDLELPTLIEASQRESPSKRGMLRFYSETTIGKVQVKNLPGIAGRDGDAGTFTGRVLLRLEHQSHSNPSVAGILQQRLQAEPTWGVAALDYADLSASSIPPPPAEGADPGGPAAKPGSAPEKKPQAGAKPAGKLPDKGKPAAARPAAPKPGEKEHPEHEEDLEGQPIITNARVLRGGIEIFAFVEWETRTGGTTQRIYGSVRLLRNEAAAPAASPRTKPPVSVRAD